MNFYYFSFAGVPASQDPKLQNDIKELQHRITRMERGIFFLMASLSLCQIKSG